MSEVALDSPGETQDLAGGLKVFLLTLGALIVLRTALGFVLFPDSTLAVANFVTGAVFLCAPMVALFFAGKERWTVAKAAAFLVCGLVLQFGLFAGLRYIPGLATGPAVNFFEALSQAGLPVWTVGLGALIATLLKDKNMLLPIAITLAILDLMLVLTPIGTVNQVMQRAPKVFQSVALNLPQVQSAHQPQRKGHRLRAAGYAGPADFVFLSMFFVALFRFKMRTRETLLAVMPTLLLYLVLTGFLGPLPALVPIGLVVLIVNRKEFVLTREEKVATVAVALIGVVLLTYAATRPRQHAVPLPPGVGQGSPKSGGLPSPAPANPRR